MTFLFISIELPVDKYGPTLNGIVRNTNIRMAFHSYLQQSPNNLKTQLTLNITYATKQIFMKHLLFLGSNKFLTIIFFAPRITLFLSRFNQKELSMNFKVKMRKWAYRSNLTLYRQLDLWSVYVFFLCRI